MSFLVATNVIASRPPERRPTGTPHARANILFMGLFTSFGHSVEKHVHVQRTKIPEPYSSTSPILLHRLQNNLIREGFKKQIMWNLGFLLKLGGGGVWGGFMSPTCYQVSFLLFKNDLIAPKHEKKTKNKNVITPPPLTPPELSQNSSRALKNSVILSVVSRVYQMSYKYSIKLFHV